MVPSVLADETAGKTGDLYIRSVRFSPDGKLLATGAEDRKIRVSEDNSFFLVACLTKNFLRFGILPRGVYDMCLTDTNRKYTLWIFPKTDGLLFRALATKLPEFGTWLIVHPES